MYAVQEVGLRAGCPGLFTSAAVKRFAKPKLAVFLFASVSVVMKEHVFAENGSCEAM